MRNRLALAALLACSAGAQAHVTLTVPTAAAGSRVVATFRIGHGCVGAATTALRIEVPDTIASARPLAMPGWTLAFEHKGERVSAVTWTGGEIPAEAYGEFSLLVKLPDTKGSVVFRATETCGAVVEHWSGADAEHPAPVLSVTAGGAAPAAAAAVVPATAPVGALKASVSEAWFRALPAGRPASGYFTLRNDAAAFVRLTGASSSACGTLMLHKSENVGGVSSMRDVDGMDIAPGASVSFAQGGYHLMCVDPKDMTPGGHAKVTLSFAGGGTLDADFAIRDADGK